MGFYNKWQIFKTCIQQQLVSVCFEFNPAFLNTKREEKVHIQKQEILIIKPVIAITSVI